MDRLPAAMAASLGGIIRYNAPVVRVERQSTRFRVSYREGAAVRNVVPSVSRGVLRHGPDPASLASAARRMADQVRAVAE